MTKPTFDKLEGEMFMHNHATEDIENLSGTNTGDQLEFDGGSA
jgi:hypothetical protein